MKNEERDRERDRERQKETERDREEHLVTNRFGEKKICVRQSTEKDLNSDSTRRGGKPLQEIRGLARSQKACHNLVFIGELHNLRVKGNKRASG